MKILLVDDETAQRQILAGFLRKQKYEVSEAGSGEEALSGFNSFRPQLVCTDYRMKGMNGLDLVKRIKLLWPETECLVITAYGSVDDAVACIRAGAYHYITKPVNLDEMLHLIEQIRVKQSAEHENRLLKDHLQPSDVSAGIIGNSPTMKRVMEMAAKVAPTSTSLLLRGETGTGKGQLASWIHNHSQRKSGRFVPVNCGALPENLVESELFGHEKGAFTGADRMRTGKFEFADGGTLFLDEIGDLPALAQVKLLRVLQEKVIERVGGNQPIPVDVRIIAATHQNLEQLIQTGKFREDLYYRLNVISLSLPALRERREDLAPLCEGFLKRFASEYRKPVPALSPDAFSVLLHYEFPGNIRELENLIQRAVLLSEGQQILPADLPVAGAAGYREEAHDPDDFYLNRQVQLLEMSLINRALTKTKGNQLQASKLLGLSERNLRFKMEKYHIRKD